MSLFAKNIQLRFVKEYLSDIKIKFINCRLFLYIKIYCTNQCYSNIDISTKKSLHNWLFNDIQYSKINPLIRASPIISSRPNSNRQTSSIRLSRFIDRCSMRRDKKIDLLQRAIMLPQEESLGIIPEIEYSLRCGKIAERTRRKKTRRKRSAILGRDNPARRFPCLRRDGFVLPPLLKRTRVRRYLRPIYLSNRMENTCFAFASGLITGVAIEFEAICRHRYLTKLNCKKNVTDVFCSSLRLWPFSYFI